MKTFKYSGAMNTIFNMIKATDSFAKNALSNTPLTRIEAVYLRILWENPGISQLELAKIKGTHKSIAVSYVTKLEKKTMLKKVESDNKKLIFCTKLGEETILNIMKLTEEILDNIFDGMDPKEIERYFEITKKMSEKFTNSKFKTQYKI